jgi:hypothetical protein
MKAFPHKVYLETTDPTVQNPVVHAGMDLRDYFAANAPIEFTDLDCVLGFHWDNFSGKELINKLAIARYDYADAMMKAREQ